MFGDVVNRKLASKDYKNIDLRKSQICIFPKKFELCFSFFSKIGSEMLMGRLKFENCPFQYIKTRKLEN